MRKLLTMTAVALVASTAAASAMTIEFKPYVGAEVGYMKTHSEDAKIFDYKLNSYFEDTQYTGALIAGSRISKNFGIEVFLQRGKEEKKNVKLPEAIRDMINIPVNYKIKTTSQLDYAWGLDLNGYLPLTEKVELVGTFGVGSYNFTHGVTGGILGMPLGNNFSINQKEENVLGLRFALGVDYKINDQWSARANFRYVELDPSALEWTDNLKEFTLGLRYAF